MNTANIELVVTAFQNTPDLDPSDIESLGIVLDMVARKNFEGASYSLKNVATARLFYPEEYRVHIAFLKAIKLELMALGKEHYHAEIAKRVDYLFNSTYFTLDMGIILPAISYENKKVLNVEKLEDAVTFYENRKEDFDPVISRILQEIDIKHNLMKNYLKDM
jgi:hypothetical protein